MKHVLDLHKDYPSNRKQLAGKQPEKVNAMIPEDLPSLAKFKPNLDYDGQVAKSCIHCHQIRDAQRMIVRERSKPLSEKMLFPYPGTETVGFKLDPKTRATIMELIPNSRAAKIGLQAKDEIKSVNGQSISSAADLQWILHHSENDDELDIVIQRRGQELQKQFTLEDGWRNSVEISWRPTSWDLRRMATGGTLLVPLEDAERKKLEIPKEQMALLVKHVGQYGNHARAKNAGVRTGDVLVAVDDQRDLLTESKIIEYGMTEKKPGDAIQFSLLRNGRPVQARFKLQ